MKQYIPVIAIATALAFTASAADAGSKHHKRHGRHTRGAAIVAPPAPSWGFGPPRPMGPPDPYRCYQDEGYGRWTICGQGRS